MEEKKEIKHFFTIRRKNREKTDYTREGYFLALDAPMCIGFLPVRRKWGLQVEYLSFDAIDNFDYGGTDLNEFITLINEYRQKSERCLAYARRI